MIQLADLFSVPEMGLLCNVTEYFLRNHIDYHPKYFSETLRIPYKVVILIMHGLVVQNVSEYLEQNKDLKRFLIDFKKAE